jgi:hypothetical protein
MKATAGRPAWMEGVSTVDSSVGKDVVVATALRLFPLTTACIHHITYATLVTGSERAIVESPSWLQRLKRLTLVSLGAAKFPIFGFLGGVKFPIRIRQLKFPI